MPHRLSLAILAGVVLAVAAFLGLAHLLGLTAPYAGFLFVLYWTGLKHAAAEEFWPGLAGALTGIGLAWAVHALPLLLGPAGLALMLLLILAVIYATIRGWVPQFINMAAMLFLTVATIPALNREATLGQMALAVLLAALLLRGGMLVAKLFRRPAGEPASL